MFDVAIIGAGINGASLAYKLKTSGKSVVVFEKDSIASGGSGAAGAFIAPKFAKTSELTLLLEKSYLNSLEFYEKKFNKYINLSPLVHIAKNSQESTKILQFKESTSLQICDDNNFSTFLSDKDSTRVCLKHSAVVDAIGVCNEMLKDIEVIYENVDTFSKEDDFYSINSIKAKKLIFTTGGFKNILDEPYFNYRAIFGHRIDIRCSNKLDFIHHKDVSVSCSKDDALVSVGATHDIHFDMFKEEFDYKKSREVLLQKASNSIDLKDVEVVEDFIGIRCGSNDYMPIVGRVVDYEKTIKKYPKLLNGQKVDFDQFEYMEDIYMINGVGGYGFVLAPTLADDLYANMFENKKLNKNIDLARFVSRYAKRVKNG